MLPKTTFFDRLLLNKNRIYDNLHFKQLPKPVRILVKSLISVGWMVCNIHTVFSKKHIEMPYLEIMVTEKCSLRCMKCSNLMPLFQNPKDISLDCIIESMDMLLASVDRIYLLKILGGEAFMYKQLPQLIHYLSNQRKIVQIEITTNGTIVPDTEIMTALRNSQVKVMISRYGNEISKNFNRLVATLDENHIPYGYPDFEFWTDFGDFNPRKRTVKENTDMFSKCSLCVTLIDGAIYCCPRAGNGIALGLVPKIKEEFVPLMGSDYHNIVRDLYNFSKLKVISTCDFCDNPGPKIPVAQQMKDA